MCKNTYCFRCLFGLSIALDLKICLRIVVLAFVTLVNISVAALNDRNSSRKRNFCAGNNPLHDVTIIFNLIHIDGGDIHTIYVI